MAFHRHPVACIRRIGNGVQRLGGDGKAALRFRLFLPFAAVGMGNRRLRGNDCRNENGLPPLQTSGSRIFAAGIHRFAVNLGIFSRPVPSYSSLDSLCRILISALGNRQARHHFVPSFLSGKQEQIHA